MDRWTNIDTEIWKNGNTGRRTYKHTENQPANTVTTGETEANTQADSCNSIQIQWKNDKATLRQAEGHPDGHTDRIMNTPTRRCRKKMERSMDTQTVKWQTNRQIECFTVIFYDKKMI